MLLGTVLNASACGKIHERSEHSQPMADEPLDSAWAVLKQDPDRHPGPEHLSGQRVPEEYPMNLHSSKHGIGATMNVGASTRDLLQFAIDNDMSLQEAHNAMQKITQEEHMLNQLMYDPRQLGDVLPQNVGEPTFQSVPFNEGTNFTMGESMDLAFRLLKRDEPFGPASRSQRPYGPISPEDLRRLQLQALRRMQGLQANPEEQKRLEIEAANAEARKRLQAQQAPKISNYMADSAESMARNNPTANLAHASGRLPGVPLPDTEPLDLSMESLRENQE